MRDVHAAAAALLEWAKKRNLGIEVENPCAEIIIRAERKIGAETLRLRDANELRRTGGWYGNQTVSPASVQGEWKPAISELGLTTSEVFRWRELAKIPDEEFDSLVAELLALPDHRLSRMDFVRAYFGPPKKVEKDPLHDDVDAWTNGWARVVDGMTELGDALDNGWPIQSDRTHRGWAEVFDQINAVGRNLLLFQKRVATHMTALGVCSMADMVEVQDDD
jgi:hypothetical protein